MKRVLVFALLIECVLPGAGGQPAVEETSREMLEAHNRVRAAVSVAPLEWSAPLAQYAQEWAQQLAKEGRLRHRPQPKYGENLYLVENGRSRPNDVVGSWASEEKDWDQKTNSCRAPCGHWTQMVWRDTKRLGCGEAHSGAVQVWVCNYEPHGNIAGEKPY